MTFTALNVREKANKKMNKQVRISLEDEEQKIEDGKQADRSDMINNDLSS